MNIDELVDNFELFDDWEDKYSYIISLGKKLPKMPEELKAKENKVEGCVSNVWIVLDIDDKGNLIMQADSDAMIVKGLVFIIYTAINNSKLEDLVDLSLEEKFKEIGLDEHLSPNRRNGFYSMINKIDAFIKVNT